MYFKYFLQVVDPGVDPVQSNIEIQQRERGLHHNVCAPTHSNAVKETTIYCHYEPPQWDTLRNITINTIYNTLKDVMVTSVLITIPQNRKYSSSWIK